MLVTQMVRFRSIFNLIFSFHFIQIVLNGIFGFKMKNHVCSYCIENDAKKHLTMTVVVRWYFTISLFLVRIDDVDEVLISYLHL